MAHTYAAAQRFCLPGFGLPVNFKPNAGSSQRYKSGLVYPSAVLYWHVDAMTVRERNMLEVMNQLTDKDEWERKIFDETIVEKWRKEAVSAEPQLTTWSRYTFTNSQGFTDQMFNFCIAELRDKARVYKDTKIVRIFDTAAAVVKSDTIVSPELKKDITKAVADLLEDVPDRLKDWHPGSNQQVLDLVHPSLFPLVYGRTRILPDSTIGLGDCLKSTGSGELIPVPPAEEGIETEYDSNKVMPTPTNLWSTKFQWLPCEAKFTTNGNIKIESYINNLHPIKHKALYPLVEQVLDAAVPLWDEVLGFVGTNPFSDEYKRIDSKDADYIFDESEDAENEDEEEEDEDDWDHERNKASLDKDRTLILPDPHDYGVKDKEQAVTSYKDHLRTTFASQGLQVIVKLANIMLTPDEPTYEGGSWHVEGQLNERICATAIYYYDSENVTDSYLGFRQKVDTYGPEDNAHSQDDYGGLEFLFDITQHESAVQDIGRVKTSEGRLIAFPNVMQHRVSPFALQDPTKPGHRKIIALFLVDPHTRVISTANVPPQRKDWWFDVLRENGSLQAFPEELAQHINDDVEDWPMGMEEAKVLREELMEERRAYIPKVENTVYSQEFSFCEH
ncbi:hypothetical protein SLS56_010437 [Neofusicoccum ribis]|uniref:Fe2OG dioxygenase domain-containing protein n=1 Tax=Neofusicoccum ribis TaxID=45134 RepID=A0ABR3SEF2_9PEZI